MGCGDVRLLRTIRSVDFTGQERAALNKLTMPCQSHRQVRILSVGIVRASYDSCTNASSSGGLHHWL